MLRHCVVTTACSSHAPDAAAGISASRIRAAVRARVKNLKRQDGDLTKESTKPGSSALEWQQPPGSPARPASPQQSQSGGLQQKPHNGQGQHYGAAKQGGGGPSRTHRVEARVPQKQQQSQQQAATDRQSRSSVHASASASANVTSIPDHPYPEGLRKHLKSRPDPALGLPRLNAVVIVEGGADAFAVQQAVDCQVYVMAGSRIKAAGTKADILALQGLGMPLVILTDPDQRGREFRIMLDDALNGGQADESGRRPTVLHAFVPVAEATSRFANMRHDVGNVGIEYASRSTLRRCLAASAPGFGPGRKEFSEEDLIKHSLVNPSDTVQVKGAKGRREQLGNVLGLGSCRGSSLLTSLNRYFTRHQFEAACRKLEQ